ncbi:MAG: toxin-antitoxin system YwqK family antitoxin [Bacteroidales bacterium]|nr:toxin-antitoxin system YwqK family antitoxin [Bacteroidales bacterium]
MKILRLFTYILPIFVLISSCSRTKTEYYPDGTVKSVIHYKGGKENGLMTYYRSDGGKALEVMMKDGKKDGKLTRWYLNGAIEDISYYKNDSLHGPQSLYDMQGHPTLYIEYSNGKKNGAYRSWHQNEMVKEEGGFKDDLYDGDWEYYDNRGVLVGEAHFSAGAGEQTAYDSFGNLLRVTTYSRNLKNGAEKYYNGAGEVVKTITYKDDRIVSIDTLSID